MGKTPRLTLHNDWKKLGLLLLCSGCFGMAFCTVELQEVGDLGPVDANDPDVRDGLDLGDQPDGPVPGCDSCSPDQAACVSMSQIDCVAHGDLCTPLVRLVSVPGAGGSSDTDQVVSFRLVDDGPFLLGCTDEYDADCASPEEPLHRIVLGAFYLQETEVTVGQFQRCVEAFQGEMAGCNPADFHARDARHLTCNYVEAPVTIEETELPMNCVNRQGAQDFCRFLQGRLPTEAEWEKAARGGCEPADSEEGPPTCVPGVTSPRDNPLYPWGDDEPGCDEVCWSPTELLCTPRIRACAVASSSLDLSPYGIADLAGNVAEWVHDDYRVSIYQTLSDGDMCPYWSDTVSDRNSVVGIVRGGSFTNDHPADLRVSRRGSHRAYRTEENELDPTIGFRCVLDIQR